MSCSKTLLDCEWVGHVCYFQGTQDLKTTWYRSYARKSNGRRNHKHLTMKTKSVCHHSRVLPVEIFTYMLNLLRYYQSRHGILTSWPGNLFTMNPPCEELVLMEPLQSCLPCWFPSQEARLPSDLMPLGLNVPCRLGHSAVATIHRTTSFNFFSKICHCWWCRL